MAKKSMVERERKRQKLVAKHNSSREILKAKIKEADSFEAKLNYHRQLQALPRNSAPSRLVGFVGFYQEF